MKNKIHKSFRGISFLRRLKIQEENSKKTSFLNYLDENKKKYFIYRHYSLNLLLNDYIFYEKFNENEKIFEKQIKMFKKQSNMLNIFNNNSTDNSEKKNVNQKNFFLKGGIECYNDISQNLINRGFNRIEKPNKNNYNFLWTLLTSDINKIEHNKDVIVNHFLNNGSITRKSGLIKSLKNLYFKGINPDNFYPRCYNLGIREDYYDFLEDYKLTYIMGILKKYKILCEKINNKEDKENEIENNIIKKESENYSEDLIKLCIKIIERNMKYFCNEYKEREDIEEIELINENEWKNIYFDENKENEKKDNSNNLLPNINEFKKVKEEDNKNKDQNKNISKDNNNQVSKNNNNKNKLAPPKIYLPKITKLLNKLKKKLPQYSLNGFRNIWIIKPCSLSRGRGIKCLSSLSSIKETKKSNNDILIQKYIENPLIILNRKFDIRQWVLVSSLDPLIIWLWNSPYLRFGAEDYNINDLNNIYGHLTNNSIGKHSENFGKNSLFEGDMWELEKFKEFLMNKYNKDCWNEIRSKIKNIVITSFESARYEMEYRCNSFELFGYDFMIDEDLNVYLIEVNGSPAMGYTTKVTEKLVKEMSDDLLKVIVDNKNKNVTKIGNFSKIYAGKNEINQNFVPNKNLPF